MKSHHQLYDTKLRPSRINRPKVTLLRVSEEVVYIQKFGVGKFVSKNPIPEKAASPIAVTESGTTNDVNEEHPQKAQSPIAVTESGTTNDVNEEHP